MTDSSFTGNFATTNSFSSMAKEKLSTDSTQLMEEKIRELEYQISLLTQSREEYKKNYLHLKGAFQKQTRIFYEYQSLSNASQEALSGIFKGSTFEEFISCGVQPNNIDALWEYTRTQALAQNITDVSLLTHMILYFVHLYNITNDTPLLGMEEVSPGDTFDVDLHIRTQDSKASGLITAVLLPGLTNAYSGAVIKKAVVTIDGTTKI